MTARKGIFTISLDFELYWGVRDKKPLESYKENILGARRAVPVILKLFDEYKIHATWTIVGFLFFDSRDELVKGLPVRRPGYVNNRLSPYNYIANIGKDEKEDPFHYAPSLVKMISSYPYQEVGSHTFSHYYCLEAGQDAAAFKDDLEAGIKAAKKYNMKLESLSLPRNQFNHKYVPVCKEMKIISYRGNEPSWIYKAQSDKEESSLKKAARLIDAYLNISGHNCYAPDKIGQEAPFNIPSSRFLRPYSDKLKILEPLRLKRILSSLTYAAKKGLIFHLWWHPHNFGADLEQNISFLRNIFDQYAGLRNTYGTESLNMGEIAHMSIQGAEYESR